MARPKIPVSVQDQILAECRRRCALCFALDDDITAKVHGQIAHIDRNPKHNDAENLAYPCLEHANLYDVVSKQSKGFTPGELTRYKVALLLVLEAVHDPHIMFGASLAENTDVSRPRSGKAMLHDAEERNS